MTLKGIISSILSLELRQALEAQAILVVTILTLVVILKHTKITSKVLNSICQCANFITFDVYVLLNAKCHVTIPLTMRKNVQLRISSLNPNWRKAVKIGKNWGEKHSSRCDNAQRWHSSCAQSDSCYRRSNLKSTKFKYFCK